MSGGAAVTVAIAVAWLVIGAVLSFVMQRRGHDGFGWGVLGTVLGPLGVALALDATRQERDRLRRVVAPGVRRDGPVAVLVGIDGSPEAAAAVSAAVDLLGPRLGRLTLATVLDFEAASGTVPREAVRAARAELLRQAERVTDITPRLEVLAGRPAEALTELAVEGAYELLVIGRRGHGRTRLLFGSVASRLAARTKVPVLVVGPQ